MSTLVNIIKSHSNSAFLDEDGNPINIQLKEGVVKEDIITFEKNISIDLPKELKELFAFSNGLDLFGITLCSMEEMDFFEDSQLLGFHNWGNGDFDCISLGGLYPKGSIVFMAHNEDTTTLVSNDLTSWIEEVISEIKKTGALRHPLEYNKSIIEGVYKNSNTHNKEW